MQALALGAADYLPKPSNVGALTGAGEFRRLLVEKIKALGRARRRRLLVRGASGAPVFAKGAARSAGLHPYVLRAPGIKIAEALVIGSSTGGPQALLTLLGDLKTSVRQPILITQHMPPTFTTILAEHLSRAGAKPVHEAVSGEPVLAGKIYLAPGGKHMRVERHDGTAVIVLDDGPAVHYCKPAVDPLFSSAAKVWGAWNLALILTGMGSDGALGATDIVACGGSVIAQDEATSVIWGMPGTAAGAGVCSAVLPLEQIAPKIVRLFLGAKS